MSTISPSRIARAQQRRGLGEPSRLEASPLRHFDWLLIGAAFAITALGLVMIYSTTHNRIPGDPYYFVKRQALFAAIGVVAMVVVLLIDYRRMRELAMVFYGVTVLLLLAVLAPVGSNVKGHQAWFQLPGGFTLQPSELAKFGLIVALAGYCNAVPRRVRRVAPHRDHRPGQRPDRPRAPAARPRDGDGPGRDHRGHPRRRRGEREAAGRARAPRGHRCLRGRRPRGAEAVPDRPPHDVPRSRERDQPGHRRTTSEQSTQAIAHGRTTGEGCSTGPRPRVGSSPSSTPTSSSPRWGRSWASSAGSSCSRSSPS